MSKKLTTRDSFELDAKRRATIELARQKVMASFKGVPENYVEVEKEAASVAVDSKPNKRMAALEKIRRDREARKQRAGAGAQEESVAEEVTDKFEVKTYNILG